MKSSTPFSKSMAVAAAMVFCSLAIPVISQAEEAPPAHIADPEVYEVLAENDQFRVVRATWKPGQRDAYHSHPANAAYRLTDCKNKVYRPDGSIAREGEPEAGSVKLQNPIASHSFENVSDHECQTLIVERK